MTPYLLVILPPSLKCSNVNHTMYCIGTIKYNMYFTG